MTFSNHDEALVLALRAESRTMPIISRASRIQDAIGRGAASTSVLAELDEQLTLFCAYPAARELPPALD